MSSRLFRQGGNTLTALSRRYVSNLAQADGVGITKAKEEVRRLHAQCNYLLDSIDLYENERIQTTKINPYNTPEVVAYRLFKYFAAVQNLEKNNIVLSDTGKQRVKDIIRLFDMPNTGKGTIHVKAWDQMELGDEVNKRTVTPSKFKEFSTESPVSMLSAGKITVALAQDFEGVRNQLNKLKALVGDLKKEL